MFAVLVQSRRKPHGVGKIQTHGADCRLRNAPGNQSRPQKLRGNAEMVKKVQRLETEAMRRFRVEREEQRPEGAVKHAPFYRDATGRPDQEWISSGASCRQVPSTKPSIGSKCAL